MPVMVEQPSVKTDVGVRIATPSASDGNAAKHTAVATAPGTRGTFLDRASGRSMTRLTRLHVRLG